MSLLLLFQPATSSSSSPTLLQTAKGNGGGYVTSYTLAFASPVTAGSLLVMSITADAATVVNTITDTRGNTWKLAAKTTGTNRNSRLYYVENAVAGTTTVTIPTGNFNDSATIIREYSGMALSAALDAVTIATDGGYTTTHTSGTTAATALASELIIATFSGDDAASTWTAGTGFSNGVYQGGGDLYMTNGMEDKIVSATGTQSATMTSSSGTLGDSIIATFKTAVAAPTYTSPTTGVPGASGQSNWYTYGYAPNVALATRLNYMQNAWNQWVSYTVTQTGMPSGMPAGAYRVKVPDQNDPTTGLPNHTFSEGIGYGMLAAVYMGNSSNPKYDANAKAYFDGFWKYYTFFKDANGLMNWRIDHLGNVTGTGGATDGDTDVAMALVLASRLWGNAGAVNYGASATTLINAIAAYEFYPATHANTAIRNTIINGDQWDATQSGSPDWVMPDYFAPAWYREFYAHTGNTRWLDIITAGYNQLIQPYDTAYNTGMVPDNATRAGAQHGTDGYNFAYNAIRYPWRMASDYLWNGTNTNPLAYYFPKKLAAFTNTQAAGVASASKAEWNLSGTTNAGYILAAFTQAYAASTLVDSTTSTWGASLMAYSDTNNTSAYFGNSLVLMTAILAAGQATPTFASPPLTASMSGSGTMTAYASKPGVTRTNLFPNPSFEVNVTDPWTTTHYGAGTLITQDTTTSAVGGASMKVDSNGGSRDDGNWWDTVWPAGTYTVSWYQKTDANVTNGHFVVRDVTGGNALKIENHIVGATPWTRYSGTFTFGVASQVQILVGLGSYGVASPGITWFDGILVEKVASLDRYFDGSTVYPGYTDAWTGTAHNSTSTEALTTGPVSYPVTAGISGAGSMTAGLSVSTGVAAAASSTGTMTAAVQNADTIASSMTGAGSMTAAITNTDPVTASMSGTGSTTAALQPVTKPMLAAASGQATMTAAPIGVTAIAGSITGTGTMSAALTASTPVTSAMAGSGSMTADFQGGLAVAAAMAGAATVAATLQAKTSVAAAASGLATMSAALTDATTLTAPITGAATVTSAIGVTEPITATMAGAGTITSAISNKEAVTSASSGTGSMTAALNVATTVGAGASGQATVSAALLDTELLNAAMVGGSTMSANFGGGSSLTVTMSGTASVTATIAAIENIQAVIAGQATATAAIGNKETLSTAINGTSTVTAGPSNRTSLLASIFGTASVTAAINKLAAFPETPGQPSYITPLRSGGGYDGYTALRSSEAATALRQGPNDGIERLREYESITIMKSREPN